MRDSDLRRAEHVLESDGEPISEFTGDTTPYINYQSIDVLLSLQRPLSAEPAELTFYIIGQVKELLFKLVYEELSRARALLDANDPSRATFVLRRVRRVIELLTGTWDVIGTLTPTEFNRFRDCLGNASGVQSYMYRMVEYILGNKVPELAEPHRNVPAVNSQVQTALHAPSVYDAAVRLLARRGALIPEAIVNRDFSHSVAPSPQVEQAWADIYQEDEADEMFELAEALMGVAEAMCRWRSIHLLTVERIIGFKPGTGGTHGVSWLRRIAEHRFFPELWTVRSIL